MGERAPEAAAESKRASLKPEGAALLIGVLAGMCFASEGAVLDWSAIYMRSELGAATEAAAAGYAGFSATMAIGRFLGDWVRSHLGATLIVRAGACLAIAGMLLGPATGSPILAVIGFAIAGLGLSNVVPVLISAAGNSPNPEIAIATVATLGYAGLLAAPPLLGFVAHATSLGMTFGIVAAMCLIIAPRRRHGAARQSRLAGLTTTRRRVRPEAPFDADQRACPGTPLRLRPSDGRQLHFLMRLTMTSPRSFSRRTVTVRQLFMP